MAVNAVPLEHVIFRTLRHPVLLLDEERRITVGGRTATEDLQLDFGRLPERT